jgi:cellulose biosynthesis protein BcsQ
MLADATTPLRSKFDIALIDFPGHEVGPFAKCGLRASDWWLFPTIPDRVSTRNLEGPSQAIQEVSKYTDHQLMPLGTLINICQNRSSGEYRKTKNALKRLVESNAIPPMFDKEAEISFDTAAKNALDELRAPEFRTLDQKYGGSAKPLAKSLRSLSRQVLHRLEMPAEDVTPLTFIERVNTVLTGFWR